MIHRHILKAKLLESVINHMKPGLARRPVSRCGSGCGVGSRWAPRSWCGCPCTLLPEYGLTS